MREHRCRLGSSLMVAVWAAVIAAALMASPVVAAEPDLVGTWQGALVVPGGKLRLVFKVAKGPEGALTAVMVSPDQSANEIPVNSVSLEAGKVSFRLAAVGGGFEGQFSDDGSKIDGNWQQSGQSLLLVLTRSDGEEPEAPDPDEIWEGVLEAPGVKLTLAFRVFEAADGTRTALMDSPNEGITGIPVTVDGEGDTVRFTVAPLGGTFEGKRSEDDSTMEGEWSQGGQSLPLVLKRTEEVSELKRPQEPQEPYPYDQEEVAYASTAADVRLAGTLTLPRIEGPFPAVLLLSGSGAQDRDETVFGHRPFLILADHLTRQGIAVLRVDDRGVGGSTGDPSTATTDDFVDDALAGVKFLKTRPDVDPGRIGLVGHSEGGLIAPRAAVRSKDVAFIVMLAGPGLVGEEILTGQGAAIGRAMGWDEETLALHRSMQDRIFAVLRREKDNEAATEEIRKVMRELMTGATEEQRQALSLSEDVIEAQAATVTSPWFRFFLSHDPVPTLKKVKCPVLALNGELDLQVLADDNLAAIQKALESGGNRDYQVKKLPDLNHLFQTAETGSVAEYGAIEETMSPVVLKLIAGWILERDSPKAGS